MPIDFQKIVQETYQKIAKDFSFSRNYVWDDLRVFLTYIKDGDTLLDLGCGNGRLVDLFRDRDVKYTGVDSSSELIVAARQHFPLKNFLVMDARAIDFPSDTFDAVMSVSVLNHIGKNEDQLLFLKNVYKVLKPGGYLLLSNWNLWSIDNPKNLMDFETEKMKLSDDEFEKKYQCSKNNLGPRDVMTVWGGNQEILYYYAFTKEGLTALLESIGFKIETDYYSRRGEITTQELGSNIITIARK